MAKAASKNSTAIVNVFANACDARINSQKSSEGTRDVMKSLKAFVSDDSVVAFLNASNVKTAFDFDVHSVRQVKDVLNVAMGKGNALRDLKEDFFHGIKTMLAFGNAELAFSAKDIEICLDKKLKIADASKAALYSRRTDFYANAGNWQNRVITVMRELNAITAISKSEYKLNANALVDGLKKAFA